MNISRVISMSLIIVGGVIAVYAETGANQNQYILVAGIFVLMMGVYRISRNIPSKHEKENSNNSDE